MNTRRGDRQNDHDDGIDLTIDDTDTECSDERSNNVVSSVSFCSSAPPPPSAPSIDIECQWILVPPETLSEGIHNDSSSKFIQRIEICLFNLSSTSLGDLVEEKEQNEQSEQRTLLSSPFPLRSSPHDHDLAYVVTQRKNSIVRCQSV